MEMDDDEQALTPGLDADPVPVEPDLTDADLFRKRR
jgi:hypothetical protein